MLSKAFLLHLVVSRSGSPISEERELDLQQSRKVTNGDIVPFKREEKRALNEMIDIIYIIHAYKNGSEEEGNADEKEKPVHTR